MASIAEKLLKNSTLKDVSIITDSELLNNVTETRTQVPMFNAAFSGKLDGGFGSGITVFAGPSKHFKSLFGLLMVREYLNQHEDAMCMFYDSEYGSAVEYFEMMGIDPRRVVHNPVEDIEELKFDIVKQLDGIERGEHVIFFIDSVGNLASKKEAQDALDGKSVADMTRAKEIKSLFRITTPKVVRRDITMIVVAHTYNTMEMYSKAVVSGGTGIMYSSNNVFIIGKRQNKDGKDLEGFDFILNVEKSRKIKERSAIPITVSFEKGIEVFSGLLDIARVTGFVTGQGWYTRTKIKGDKKWRKSDLNCIEFWEPILCDPEFQKIVNDMYALDSNKFFTEDMIASVDVDEETGEVTQ